MTRGDYANATDFLNEMERGIVFSNPDSEWARVIMQRGKMFLDIHNEWREYIPKENKVIILKQGDWELNVRLMLLNDYNLDESDTNRVLGQYFDKIRRLKNNGEDIS